MLRFLENTTFTLAKKVCRKGMMMPLQYRDLSFVGEKDVPKIYGYFFKAVFGGAGFLLGMWFV
ncbi:hypothetical protein HA466_0130910 [Hirschfeldia incana]|nr:hypothetical protein HA466_0130910 [Hirschfeldia incana]